MMAGVLEGKVAVVTGAGGNLGQPVVNCFWVRPVISALEAEQLS